MKTHKIEDWTDEEYIDRKKRKIREKIKEIDKLFDILSGEDDGK